MLVAVAIAEEAEPPEPSVKAEGTPGRSSVKTDTSPAVLSISAACAAPLGWAAGLAPQKPSFCVAVVASIVPTVEPTATFWPSAIATAPPRFAAPQVSAPVPMFSAGLPPEARRPTAESSATSSTVLAGWAAGLAPQKPSSSEEAPPSCEPRTVPVWKTAAAAASLKVEPVRRTKPSSIRSRLSFSVAPQNRSLEAGFTRPRLGVVVLTAKGSRRSWRRPRRRCRRRRAVGRSSRRRRGASAVRRS